MYPRGRARKLETRLRGGPVSERTRRRFAGQEWLKLPEADPEQSPLYLWSSAHGQLIHPVTCLVTVQGFAGRVLVATSSVPLGVSHTTHEVHLEMPGEPGRARLTGDRERSPVFWAHHTVAAPA